MDKKIKIVLIVISIIVFIAILTQIILPYISIATFNPASKPHISLTPIVNEKNVTLTVQRVSGDIKWNDVTITVLDTSNNTELVSGVDYEIIYPNIEKIKKDQNLLILDSYKSDKLVEGHMYLLNINWTRENNPVLSQEIWGL